MDLRFILRFDLLSGAAASGPVRLFTPYKRRRRNQTNEQTPNNVQAKQKKSSAEEEIEHDHSGGGGGGVGGGGGGGGIAGGGGMGAVVGIGGASGGGCMPKTEETTWESITDGIDGTSEYIDTSSQSEYCTNACVCSNLIVPIAFLCCFSYLVLQFWLNVMFHTIA